MDDLSRRELLRVIGSSITLTAAGAGVLTPALAQHVHQEVSMAKSLAGGPDYKPAYFTPHQLQTMRKLAELILPGATEAGAAEYIDFLCSRNEDLALIYSGGLAWMDDYTRRKHDADFLESKADDQTALLDRLAYRKNASPETATGEQFFVWARNMVVDAYYTSPAGVAEIGFMGNKVRSEFSVPKEAVEYALKRSPFANDAA
jgi:gluconate 2-dehydrogenase gamma chain